MIRKLLGKLLAKPYDRNDSDYSAYSTTYLFTPVTSSVNNTSVANASSGSITLTLADYPPSIVSTSAFLAIVVAIVPVAAAAVATYLLLRKRLPKLLAKLRSLGSRPPASSSPG